MRFLSAAACLALLADAASGVDLAGIDRSVGKEPVYESAAPQYCLLAFGPEANVRVWAVLDGDVLYLDRNGNGDLTDPGERMLPRIAWHRPEKRPDLEMLLEFTFFAGNKPEDEPLFGCLPEMSFFDLTQTLCREDCGDPERVKYYRERPFRVAVNSPAGTTQDAQVAFAGRPQDAPILHFHGPLQLAFSEREVPIELRGGETTNLFVYATTPSLNAVVRTYNHGIPKSIFPVAEIECPPRLPVGARKRFNVELTERC